MCFGDLYLVLHDYQKAGDITNRVSGQATGCVAIHKVVDIMLLHYNKHTQLILASLFY